MKKTLGSLIKRRQRAFSDPQTSSSAPIPITSRDTLKQKPLPEPPIGILVRRSMPEAITSTSQTTSVEKSVPNIPEDPGDPRVAIMKRGPPATQLVAPKSKDIPHRYSYNGVYSYMKRYEDFDGVERLSKYSWYHGPISREAAIQLLENNSSGSFLVRLGQSESDIYIISYGSPTPNGKIIHVKLTYRLDKGGWYGLGMTRGFTSISAVLRFSPNWAHCTIPVQNTSTNYLSFDKELFLKLQERYVSISSIRPDTPPPSNTPNALDTPDIDTLGVC